MLVTRRTAARLRAGEMWSRVRHSRRWRMVPRELALVLSGVVLYFGVRGLTVGGEKLALANADHVVSLEKSLDIYVEPQMQDLVDGSRVLTTVMNWVYIWGHWPVIAVTLLWLVLEHPAGYRLTRNAMLSSGAVGLVVFASFPVAPPRLAPLGLQDTVTEYSSSYRVLQPAAFVNQYAAMPSLHVGWDLLIGIALVTYSSHLLVRAVGVLLPVFMAVSVVATANHFTLDVVAGVALVLVCYVAARRWERRRADRRRVTHPREDPGEGVAPRLPRPRGARPRPDRVTEPGEASEADRTAQPDDVTTPRGAPTGRAAHHGTRCGTG
jgi:membrane-associated phospholipid phosphatase